MPRDGSNVDSCFLTFIRVDTCRSSFGHPCKAIPVGVTRSPRKINSNPLSCLKKVEGTLKCSISVYNEKLEKKAMNSYNQGDYHEAEKL